MTHPISFSETSRFPNSGRPVSGSLFGVSATDPVVFASVAVGLTGIALLATPFSGLSGVCVQG
jgi:hypothetical protein